MVIFLSRINDFYVDLRSDDDIYPRTTPTPENNRKRCFLKQNLYFHENYKGLGIISHRNRAMHSTYDGLGPF